MPKSRKPASRKRKNPEHVIRSGGNDLFVLDDETGKLYLSGKVVAVINMKTYDFDLINYKKNQHLATHIQNVIERYRYDILDM